MQMHERRFGEHAWVGEQLCTAYPPCATSFQTRPSHAWHFPPIRLLQAFGHIDMTPSDLLVSFVLGMTLQRMQRRRAASRAASLKERMEGQGAASSQSLSFNGWLSEGGVWSAAGRLGSGGGDSRGRRRERWDGHSAHSTEGARQGLSVQLSTGSATPEGSPSSIDCDSIHSTDVLLTASGSGGGGGAPMPPYSQQLASSQQQQQQQVHRPPSRGQAISAAAPSGGTADLTTPVDLEGGEAAVGADLPHHLLRMGSSAGMGGQLGGPAVSAEVLGEAEHFMGLAFAAYGWMLFVWQKPG
jgi:hypothetical protein